MCPCRNSTVIYYVSFRQDRIGIRLYVYALFALDVVQSVAVADQAWLLFCAWWGRPDMLDKNQWSTVMIPTVSGASESPMPCDVWVRKVG